MSVLEGRLWKIVWGGSLFTQEQWSCSVSAVGLTQGAVSATAETLAAPIRDWMARPGSRLNTAARLEFVKFNEVSRITGKYLSANSDTFEVTPSIAGAADQDGPGQICLAITLRTEVARGRASKGRFFSPFAAGDFIDADGGLQSPIPKAAADSAQELLSELNAALAVGVSAGERPLVAVFSRVGNLARDAQTVSVGRVLDTQRRRRRSIPEQPIAATASI